MGREYQGKFAFANNLKPTPVFECPDELAYTLSPLRAPLLGADRRVRASNLPLGSALSQSVRRLLR